MHRPPKNCAVYLASVSLPQGWGLSLVIIIKVKVSTGEEVIIIIIKKFIIKIYALKPNLFKLITRVSCRRVYKQKSKLIATYFTTL